MVVSRRAPGRPVNAERFGRQKIIDGFLELVREGRGQILRKDIADHLCITPALVTYYFPDSSTILKEALTGVFDHWLVKIDETDQDDLSAIIDIIFSFFRIELHIEYLYRSIANDGLIKDNTLKQMENKTASKICNAIATSEGLSVMIANIIWGSARQFAFAGLERPPTFALVKMINAVGE